MKSPDEAEPEFLIGARAIRAFLNELLKPAKFSEDQVYRLIQKSGRRPANSACSSSHRLPRSVSRLATLANGDDAGGANGDGRARAK
jgi:hypothetical protein